MKQINLFISIVVLLISVLSCKKSTRGPTYPDETFPVTKDSVFTPYSDSVGNNPIVTLPINTQKENCSNTIPANFIVDRDYKFVPVPFSPENYAGSDIDYERAGKT